MVWCAARQNSTVCRLRCAITDYFNSHVIHESTGRTLCAPTRLTMERFIVEGGRKLEGSIRPGGNKNAALPILAACLLTDKPVTLRNLPGIRDVEIMLQILE